MYNIENKEKFIGRIQNLLGLPMTKRMDEATKRALISFRKRHQLKEEPLIDKELFYLLINEKKYPPHPFENLDFGSRGEDVYRLNTMLSFFINRLGLFIRIPKGEYFTRETEKAINELKQHFYNIITNSKFYHLLEHCYKTLNSKEPPSPPV